MNPPDPPVQPHRPSTSSTTCDRHPEEQFTGFCPACLCERLSLLDQSCSSSLRKPTPAAALKSIFKTSDKPPIPSRNKPSSFFPDLRRTKSFSASKGEGFSCVFEPQRKSCDVRARNTLWSLFTQDNERKGVKNEIRGETDVDTRTLASSSCVGRPVLETKVEDEHYHEKHTDEVTGEIRVSEELDSVTEIDIQDKMEEIVEEEEGRREEELKTMKDHIDLDSQSKKAPGRDFKEIAGSFWSAASVFSKKLQKWRRKQKLKKENGARSVRLPVEKPTARHYRETQSEVADYGFGRRSCDTDPRFSLDAARISFDDPRYSFDEPRASWDGYLNGRTALPRLPPMVSVVEDYPVIVSRTDAQIPVEEPRLSTQDDEDVPGGSAQTKDYYSDSSSRRRKSLDRSSSIRKTAAAVVSEMDELKSVSNAKVSPTTVDISTGSKSLVGDGELRDWNLNSGSLPDDCSQRFDIGLGEKASVVGKGIKKSRRWGKAWSIWGLIHWRSGNKYECEEKFNRVNGVERSFSESWQDFRCQNNGEARGRKVFRSNSTVSSRNSFSSSSGSLRKNGIEVNGHGKKKDDFVLERNRSSRQSPNNIDNGLLRFYLTPMKGSRRGGFLKSRSNNSNFNARSLLRLY